MGFALSSQYAFAQATYNYTGNNYTLVVPGSPYTTSMHITATLQLGSWIPPNQSCIDVRSLPGFRLIMNDGAEVNLDTSSPPSPGLYAIATVSTDSLGQIVESWVVVLDDPTTFLTPVMTTFDYKCTAPASIYDEGIASTAGPTTFLHRVPGRTRTLRP